MIFGHFYDPPRVIVQGRHGEPVKLFLYSIDSKDSYVGKCGPDKTIGLPHEQVYAYDESLFLRLIMAYEKRIWSEISTLYESIPVDDFACNKYQDVLVLPHGQEDISDIEGITGCNR